MRFDIQLKLINYNNQKHYEKISNFSNRTL